jgi:hypothetical protein
MRFAPLVNMAAPPVTKWLRLVGTNRPPVGEQGMFKSQMRTAGLTVIEIDIGSGAPVSAA